MEKENRILEEVDKTLRALDDLPKLEANPFLFTRIQAALASGATPARKRLLAKLEPYALALIVILNIFTAVYMIESKAGTSSSTSSRTQLVSSLDHDYNSTEVDF
jgi:hypothetical protein